MSKWIVGVPDDGMFWVVCESCATNTDQPYSSEDVYSELDDELHRFCDTCKTSLVV